MKYKHMFKLFFISIFAVLSLTACGSTDASKENDEGITVQTGEQDPTKTADGAENKEVASNDAENNEASETEKKDDASKEEAEDTSGAVKPKSASETVSFTQVTWFGGVPKRELHPGVWYYTEADHPEKYDDTFDWEKEDVLLWQIGDEKYRGYKGETEQLKKLDNDVVKIIVKLEEDTGDEMPRRFLKVGKGSLEGKGFIIETVDGERLSLE